MVGSYTNVPNRISSTNYNSRDAATLAANATFQGEGEDVSRYGRVGVSINGTNPCRGTLYMEVSHDNVIWGGPARAISDARFTQPHMWNIVEKYFRIRYVNGSVECKDFSIQVQYSNNADILLGHQLDEDLLDETEALITRSVLVGQAPDGEYHNVRSTEDGKLEVETDEFSHLLSELLVQQKITNNYLQVIAGYPLIDKMKD